MSATTWAEIVCWHYNLGANVAFDGNKLVHAISHNKVLSSLFDGNDRMVKEDISVFRNKYRARGMTKQVHCCYATRKGERPKGVDASSLTMAFKHKLSYRFITKENYKKYYI